MRILRKAHDELVNKIGEHHNHRVADIGVLRFDELLNRGDEFAPDVIDSAQLNAIDDALCAVKKVGI
jgi:hypothetical protein